jgi:radical SAM superfamily enzyme YgiQ (UPF0313 family)
MSAIIHQRKSAVLSRGYGTEVMIKVGLVQIGEDFGGQYYLPYSVGLLQAYAQKKLKGSFEFLTPVYKRLPIDEIVDYFKEVNIVGFSVYLWNFRYSLETAKQIKQANPKCIIIFGGSQIPRSPERLEKLLRENLYIDIACYGEGEMPFVGILESYRQKDWGEVPSIGFIADGKFVQTPCLSRISNLDDIPSPYSEGVFDKLLDKEKWSALWETNRGCPFGCAFCAWSSNIDKKIYKYGMERLNGEMDWFSRNRIEFVFCCDANFGIFKDRDLEITETVVNHKKELGYPRAFSVQNTKNATDTTFEIQKLLNDSGLQKGVNLAFQSLNPKTLESVNRSNVSIQNYQELQSRFTEAGIPTFSDIIIGLPDETYDSFADGVSKLIESGQRNRIQFINLSILENTEMAKPEYQQKHGLIIQECKMVSHHTSIDDNQMQETEYLVVGTKTMPKEDWVRVRVFAWMVSLLYFDKLLQKPFDILHKVCGISYQKLVELFMKFNEDYPLISGLNYVFRNKALAIQQGNSEYIASYEWLNIYWPADEYVFIKLCREGLLKQFYEEAERLLYFHLAKDGIKFDLIPVLHEAVSLNAQLINCPSVLDSKSVWDTWLREVVWYGTKKGAYLNVLITV